MSWRKIAITTGDVDGIGLEIALKSLISLGPQKKTSFFLFRDHAADPRLLKKLDPSFERIIAESLKEALAFFNELSRAKHISSSLLFDIAAKTSPAQWVESAAQACYKQDLSGLVTGPLSKTSIKAAGYKDLGHTDILKRVSHTKSAHMGFIGTHFNVVLATGHIPLRKVSSSLHFRGLCEALLNANHLRKMLPQALRKKPIAVLGLNPHAGEEGLIGQEELVLFRNLFSFAQKNKIPLTGPLVPDAAFLKKNWSQYSVFLALYHDQGLIPFKAIHGQDSGTHVTLGIPFVRTSVDHGTAKDIFGKNKANPQSMTEALQWALRITPH